MAASELPRWSEGAARAGDEADAALPLAPMNPAEDRFPCCVVWSPLPVVGWLVPFVGHLGLCRADGTTLDFAGSYFVNVGRMAFGSPTRFVRLSPAQACFPPNLSQHTCQVPHAHQDYGCDLSWDGAMASVVRQFQHETYNIFSCNCHSFVACCLNRMAYRGHMGWTMVHLALLMLTEGTWVTRWGALQAYAPFVVVMALGLWVSGWAFLACWAIFAFTLIGWYLFGTFVLRSLVKNR